MGAKSEEEKRTVQAERKWHQHKLQTTSPAATLHAVKCVGTTSMLGSVLPALSRHIQPQRHHRRILVILITYYRCITLLHNHFVVHFNGAIKAYDELFSPNQSVRCQWPGLKGLDKCWVYHDFFFFFFKYWVKVKLPWTSPKSLPWIFVVFLFLESKDTLERSGTGQLRLWEQQFKNQRHLESNPCL